MKYRITIRWMNGNMQVLTECSEEDKESFLFYMGSSQGNVYFTEVDGKATFFNCSFIQELQIEPDIIEDLANPTNS